VARSDGAADDELSTADFELRPSNGKSPAVSAKPVVTLSDCVAETAAAAENDEEHDDSNDEEEETDAELGELNDEKDKEEDAESDDEDKGTGVADLEEEREKGKTGINRFKSATMTVMLSMLPLLSAASAILRAASSLGPLITRSTAS
jgi:hypothetical protein